MDNADREGTHSCWRRILLLIGRQIESQSKIELLHAVVSGVVGSHGCEDFSDQAEVLLNQSLLDRLTLRGQKAGTDVLGGNLEEGNGVLNVLEVGGDLEPVAEAPPLEPGSGVFIEDGGIEPMGDCLLCSMVFRCCLHPDGRWRRPLGFICGKCVRK